MNAIPTLHSGAPAHGHGHDAFASVMKGVATMKRILSAALALSLIGGSAAYAGPHGYGHYDRGYHHGYRHHDDAGAAIAVGVGALALIAILAAQDRERREAQQYEAPRGPDAYPDQGPDQRAYPDSRMPDENGPDQGYGPDRGYGPNAPDQPLGE